MSSLTKKIADYTYSTGDLLGTGAFSSVYKCSHPEKQDLAVKVLPLKMMSESLLHSLLTRELPIMNCLKSNHIVQLHDVILTKQNVYVIMEYCQHGDLEHLVSEKGGQLDETEVWKLLKHLGIAFQELVRNKILHRDLKPANIFLDEEGNYKLGDFGLAKSNEVKPELKNSFVGTPLYMSPQCLKNTGYNNKTDIWSLGVLLFELLYNKTPWPCRSQIELIASLHTMKLELPTEPSISNEMKTLIKRCLVQEESQRIGWEEIFKQLGLNQITKVVEQESLPLQPKDSNTQNQKNSQFLQYHKLNEGVLNYQIREIIETAKELDKGKQEPQQKQEKVDQENRPEELLPLSSQPQQEKAKPLPSSTYLPLKTKSKFSQFSFQSNDQCINCLINCIQIFNFTSSLLREQQTTQNGSNELQKFDFLLRKSSLSFSTMLKKCFEKTNPLKLNNQSDYAQQSKFMKSKTEWNIIFEQNWQEFSKMFKNLNANDEFIKVIISDSQFWRYFNCQYDQGFTEIKIYSGYMITYLTNEIEALEQKLQTEIPSTQSPTSKLISQQQRLDILCLSSFIDCHQILQRCASQDFNFQKFSSQNDLQQILVKHSQQFANTINQDYFFFLRQNIQQLQI